MPSISTTFMPECAFKKNYMEIKKKENLGWIDLLRVIACFLVVFSHSCDPFTGLFDSDRNAFLTAVLSGSMVRCCVPLFVMMSGVLLFPIRLDMSGFYKKRLGRLLLPLIFWSIALPLIYYVYLNFAVSTQSPNIVMEDHTWVATLRKFYTFMFNFNYDTTPLWYVYMLAGLYFVMPIFGQWLERASRKEIELFLKIWGISLILPYLKMAAPLLGYPGNYGNMGLFGICDWNDYGSFYYVSGFIGYLVLAHYLVKYPLHWSWQKTLAICIPSFLIGYLITSLGFLETQKHFPGNYAYLEIVWYFAGINVFMMTFPVFVIVQKLQTTSSVVMSRLASLTFGIYLSHFVIVQMMYDAFSHFPALPVAFKIIGIACSAFLISAGVVWALSQLKLTRRLVQ